jgi:hypothetical protein
VGELPFAVRFHDFLREREREIAQVPKPFRAPEPLGPELTLGIELGDRRDFQVCGALPCDVDDFVTVQAEVRFVGERAVVYEDRDAPLGGLTDEDLLEFGQQFEDDLYPVAARAFGAESDVDRNGRVLILMTPVVNGLTPAQQCGQSSIRRSRTTPARIKRRCSTHSPPIPMDRKAAPSALIRCAASCPSRSSTSCST